MGRALIAEDAEPVRRLLATLLLRQGLEVVTARSGREALEHLKRTSFDVILLDLMMPDVSGYTVLEHLKTEHPQMLKHLIIVTAVSERELSRVLDENPDIRVLRKPFDVSQVADAVSRQLLVAGPSIAVSCLSCDFRTDFDAESEKVAWVAARQAGWHIVTFVKEDTGSKRMKTLAITFCPACAAPSQT
jgi:CheY-like chemotaxis protein